MAKSDGQDGGEVTGPADLKPLLHVSKQKPVSCVVALSKNRDGVILLDKRIKPRKLMAELLRRAKGGIELDTVDATLETESDDDDPEEEGAAPASSPPSGAMPQAGSGSGADRATHGTQPEAAALTTTLRILTQSGEAIFESD